MDETMLAIAQMRGGYGFRRDFIDAGYRDRDIRAALRAGGLVRLRHGTYAPASVASLSPEERHRLLCHAVLDKLGDGYALSHYSASIMYTPVSYGVDLETVHVTRLAGHQSRTEAGIAFHSADLDGDELDVVDGLPVVNAARSAFEAASVTKTESGLVIVNAGLHAELFSQDEVAGIGERGARWPNSRHARIAVRLSDPRCESAGESRSLYMFFREGIPRPEMQVVLPVADDLADPRVDFDWPAFHHTGEFDGLFKYGALNQGVDPAETLVREKRREDRVRSVPRGMSRWTWHDLDERRRADTAHRIRAGLEQSRRLYGRNAVILPLSG